MTNHPADGDPIIRIPAAVENTDLNRAAVELLLGCPPEHPDATESGRRRRQQYEHATGDTDPSILDILAHYGRVDGVPVWLIRDGQPPVNITTRHPIDDVSTVIVTDKDGLPGAVIDLDQHTTDAPKFMYELAQTAGDDAATTRVFEQWHTAHPSDDGHEFGMLCATTLSFLVRHILGPTLDACDAAGLPLRAGLKQAATQEL